MKVLIVGSGGREHAIAYCVAKSDKVEKSIVHRGMQELQNLQNVPRSEQWNSIKSLRLQRKKRWILLL